MFRQIFQFFLKQVFACNSEDRFSEMRQTDDF